MGWRSVVITQPSYLSLGVNALKIEQEDREAQVPLEDVSILVLDCPKITLTGQLLTALSSEKICVITVDAMHLPNGIYLPFLPHTRALRVMRAQIALSVPAQKKFHKDIIKKKISNQAALLESSGKQREAKYLYSMAKKVKSGDTDNMESIAAQTYFPSLFGDGFQRRQDNFTNAALNYGYAVVRSAIARTLVCYGFLPALGLFHCSEQNPFNLADDIIEPYRSFVDEWVISHFHKVVEADLTREQKAQLVNVLHQDIVLTGHSQGSACTVLAAIEATVISLSQSIVSSQKAVLNLPDLRASLQRRYRQEDEDE